MFASERLAPIDGWTLAAIFACIGAVPIAIPCAQVWPSLAGPRGTGCGW